MNSDDSASSHALSLDYFSSDLTQASQNTPTYATVHSTKSSFNTSYSDSDSAWTDNDDINVEDIRDDCFIKNMEEIIQSPTEVSTHSQSLDNTSTHSSDEESNTDSFDLLDEEDYIESLQKNE